MMKKENILWGIILVILGIMFLLNTMGILSFNVWKLFWPVALILLGLWFLVGAVFFKQLPTEAVSIPLDGIQRAKISLQHGAGALKLSSGASAQELAAGDFVGGVDYDVQRSGDEALVVFNAPSYPVSSWTGFSDGLKWDIRLNPAPDLDLNLKTGASESHLNLTELQVSQIQLSTGASAATILMPAQCAFTKARIEGGATSIEIRIPENVAARIQFEGGLVNMKVDQSRFPQTGEFYASPNYEQSDWKTEIYITGGVGSIRIV